GRYQVYVNHYSHHGGRDPTEFDVKILVGDERREFSGQISTGQPKRLIHEFYYPPLLRLAVSQRLIIHPGGSNELPARILRSRQQRGSVSLQVVGDLRGLSTSKLTL